MRRAEWKSSLVYLRLGIWDSHLKQTQRTALSQVAQRVNTAHTAQIICAMAVNNIKIKERERRPTKCELFFKNLFLTFLESRRLAARRWFKIKIIIRTGQLTLCLNIYYYYFLLRRLEDMLTALIGHGFTMWVASRRLTSQLFYFFCCAQTRRIYIELNNRRRWICSTFYLYFLHSILICWGLRTFFVAHIE